MFTMNRSSLNCWTRGFAFTTLIGAAALLAPATYGQATDRAVFVAHNGNLEGSVSAFTVKDDGTLVFVNRVVTGSRPVSSDPCPGCNAYEISLTPDGHYLATSHASGPDDNEQVTILEVAADGSIAEVHHQSFFIGAGMDLQWIANDLLAVTRVNSSPSQVTMLQWNPAGPALTIVDSEMVGGSGYYLARHPTGPYLYSASTGTDRGLRVFQVAANGTMTLIDTQSTSQNALDFVLTHDGTKLYAAGGISNVIQGFGVEVDGTITGHLAGSPFPQFGSSPSNVAISPHDRFLAAGHGTDATMRTATIDPATGMLAYTGHAFDVGTQGTLGDVQFLDDLIFVTDNSTLDGQMGIYSFTLHRDGSFTMNSGAIYETGGIAPRAVTPWSPFAEARCHGDADCDGDTDFDDIDYFVAAIPDNEAAWAALYAARHGGELPTCQFMNSDIVRNGHVDFGDIDAFVALIPSACP